MPWTSLRADITPSRPSDWLRQPQDWLSHIASFRVSQPQILFPRSALNSTVLEKYPVGILIAC